MPYVEARKQASKTGALIQYDGFPVSCVKRSWATARTAADLPGNVQTYSFRHTIARWLRMQSVPAWEVAAQLGHKAPDYSTTEIYAPFDPAYLTKATEAIDLFLGHVARQLCASTISEFLLERTRIFALMRVYALAGEAGHGRTDLRSKLSPQSRAKKLSIRNYPAKRTGDCRRRKLQE